jgi:hypothetical protein
MIPATPTTEDVMNTQLQNLFTYGGVGLAIVMVIIIGVVIVRGNKSDLESWVFSHEVTLPGGLSCKLMSSWSGDGTCRELSFTLRDGRAITLRRLFEEAAVANENDIRRTARMVKSTGEYVRLDLVRDQVAGHIRREISGSNLKHLPMLHRLVMTAFRGSMTTKVHAIVGPVETSDAGDERPTIQTVQIDPNDPPPRDYVHATASSGTRLGIPIISDRKK